MKTQNDIFNEAKPEIVTTVVSTVISTVICTVIFAIPAFLLNVYYNKIELIALLYTLLFFVAIYILFQKKQSIPVYIKQNRFIILIVLILIPVISFVSYNSSHTIPNSHIKIINTRSSEIDLSSEGEFHIVTIKGARNEKIASEIYLTLEDPGKVKLKTSDNNHPNSLKIPPNGELMVNAEIIKPERYMDYYRKDYYIYFTLYQTDNKELDTQGGLHFDKEAISKEYMAYKI